MDILVDRKLNISTHRNIIDNLKEQTRARENPRSSGIVARLIGIADISIILEFTIDLKKEA